jgi:hypothetical protein
MALVSCDTLLDVPNERLQMNIFASNLTFRTYQLFIDIDSLEVWPDLVEIGLQ